MKIWKHFSVAAIVAVFALVFIACDIGNNDPSEITREFTIKMWGKDITVRDTRTGSSDKDLKELGVIGKLEAAIIEMGDWSNAASVQAAFNRILSKGMIIIVEKPAVSYNDYKTKNDGKTMQFDIDYLTNAQTNDITGNIADAVYDYLDQGLEKAE